MTERDAQLLLGVFTTILIPVVITKLPTLNVSSSAKWLLSALISLAGGYLTTVAAGQFKPDETLIYNACMILVASQGVYYSVFKLTGLQKWLSPKAALADEASTIVRSQVQNIPTEMVKDVLDPSTDTTLLVAAKVDTV